MAIQSWLTIGQRVRGVSTDSQSICQPVILVDIWLTDALSTHYPCIVAELTFYKYSHQCWFFFSNQIS